MKKQRNAIATSLLIAVINIPTANASVNMWNGNFSHTWTDVDNTTDGTHVKISRTYNSRSLYEGKFGFGWCFNIEVKTAQQPVFSLNECDARQNSPTAKTASETQGVQLKLDDANRIQTILFRDKTIVDFEFNEVGKITQIKSPKKEINYAYQDDELIEARDGDDMRLTYRYDPLRNLTHIQFPDQSTEVMSYDEDRDLITSRQGRDGCLEIYRFSTTPQIKHVIARATRKCQGTTIGVSRHDFWHETTKDGHTYLSRMVIEQTMSEKDQRKEFRFDRQGNLMATHTGGVKNEIL